MYPMIMGFNMFASKFKLTPNDYRFRDWLWLYEKIEKRVRVLHMVV